MKEVKGTSEVDVVGDSGEPKLIVNFKDRLASLSANIRVV